MKKQTINYVDFQKLDIRVGEIKAAASVPGAKKLLELKVDLGADYGEVTILSGISEFYQPKKLVGKKYLFVANLEPKKLFNKQSQGMILVIDTPKKPFLLKVNNKFENGTIIR